ncbi:MAG: polysaccharide biosynthesis C-terminal domain-containing protein, partial [Thermoguttaceae bacterium]|nr:polysaccharide biosynthesis C-terminal domain-containing protein [Thermoguttaceae bacterium]
EDKERLKYAVHQAIRIAVVCGMVLMSVGFIGTPTALRLLRAPEEIMESATIYLRVYFCGAIASLIYNMGSGVLRAVGDAKRPLYFLIFTTIVNILLDVLFVAVFRLGVFGAALATVLSQVTSAALILYTFLKTTDSYRLVLRDQGQYPETFRKILRLGLPAGLQYTVYTISNLIIQTQINLLGTDVVAAWTATSKIDGIFWLTMTAFPATCALGVACAWSVASLNDGANLGALSPSAAAQDDPFGDDDSDPFAEEADEDVAEEVGDDSDPFGTDPNEEVVLNDDEEDADATDENDPFGAAPSTGPFAPTEDEMNAPASAPESAASTALDYAAGKDAKYLRPEDVPDAEKTEQDLFATLTPAEAAILGQNPQNAAEWLVAAIRVARVGRVEFAKILTQKSLDAPEGTPAECAAAVDSLGVGRLSYFVANATIGEAGTQAVERVSELARRHWEDEATIRDAIARMNQGTPDERAAATLDVRKGGNAAIALLTKDLVEGDEEQRRVAKSFLTFFKGEAVDALLAALRDVDEAALPAV